MRYWNIKPYHYDRPEEFAQCWGYDRNNEVIAIGWDLGDLANLSVDAIRARYDRAFPDRPLDFHQIRKFWKEILPGDRIIAHAGRKRIIGVGRVLGPPYYSQQEWERRGRGITYTIHPNFLPVHWDDTREYTFSKQVFGIQTVTELTDKATHWTAVADVLGAAESKNYPC